MVNAQSPVAERTPTDGTERRYLQPDVETMPREQLEALQERRILHLLPLAWERSAFYREHWSSAGVDLSKIRTLADFRQHIPTFTKQDVRDFRARTGDPFGGLLCVPTGELTAIMSTSGTTGDPELIPETWDTERPLPPLPMCSARDLWEVGLRPGDRVLVPPGTFRGFYDIFFHAMGFVPVYVDTWIGQGANILDAMRRFRPAYLALMMPTVLEFERLEHNVDMREALSSLKGASFAGQPLGAALARKVRDDWGVNLFTYTSAADTGTAWECREHDGYHFWEDTAAPECLDPAADVEVAPGAVGELTATDIDNKAAPLIRYRSGDLVRLSRATCGCGRTHARQWVVGRRGDETTVGRTPVVLGEVWAAVESLPETSDGMFQIIRTGPVVDVLRLRVGYEPTRTSDLDDLRGRLRETVADRVGVEPDVELVPVDELLRRSSSVAKFPRVVAE